MKNIQSLGEQEIRVRQFRFGNQGELIDRGVIRARVVRADVQTLSSDACCSRRVSSVNVDLARVDGVYYVVGAEKVLTISGEDRLPRALTRKEAV